MLRLNIEILHVDLSSLPGVGEAVHHEPNHLGVSLGYLTMKEWILSKAISFQSCRSYCGYLRHVLIVSQLLNQPPSISGDLRDFFFSYYENLMS